MTSWKFHLVALFVILLSDENNAQNNHFDTSEVTVCNDGKESPKCDGNKKITIVGFDDYSTAIEKIKQYAEKCHMKKQCKSIWKENTCLNIRYKCYEEAEIYELCSSKAYEKRTQGIITSGVISSNTGEDCNCDITTKKTIHGTVYPFWSGKTSGLKRHQYPTFVIKNSSAIIYQWNPSHYNNPGQFRSERRINVNLSISNIIMGAFIGSFAFKVDGSDNEVTITCHSDRPFETLAPNVPKMKNEEEGVPFYIVLIAILLSVAALVAILCIIIFLYKKRKLSKKLHQRQHIAVNNNEYTVGASLSISNNLINDPDLDRDDQYQEIRDSALYSQEYSYAQVRNRLELSDHQATKSGNSTAQAHGGQQANPGISEGHDTGQNIAGNPYCYASVAQVEIEGTSSVYSCPHVKNRLEINNGRDEDDQNKMAEDQEQDGNEEYSTFSENLVYE